MRPIYIKKNGKFLAYHDVVDESDYLEVSETDAEISSGWYLTDDIENARCFMDRMTAATFLARKRGEFWKGFEVVRN